MWVGWPLRRAPSAGVLQASAEFLGACRPPQALPPSARGRLWPTCPFREDSSRAGLGFL